MKWPSIFVFTLLIAGCGLSCARANSGPELKFKFGRTVLSIPKKYMLSGLPSSIVPTEGLDGGGGISLKIPLGDLKLEETIGLNNTMIVFVSAAEGADGLKPVRPDAVNAWNATGLYKNRIIEFDDDVKLYRIYPKAGYPVMWQYFSSSPDNGAEMGDNWVAACIATPGAEQRVGIENASCKTIHVYKDVRNEITLFGENIKRLSVILSGYKGMIAEWERD